MPMTIITHPDLDLRSASGAQLRELAAAGVDEAQAEITRRAEKRAAKGQRPVAEIFEGFRLANEARAAERRAAKAERDAAEVVAEAEAITAKAAVPTVKQKPSEIADEFLTACEANGFTAEVHDDILSVSRSFRPGDNAAFIEADGYGPMVLGIVPQTRPGSVWGTDGGSVGGHVALESGAYRLNASGRNKNVLKAIANRLA